ncbi:hypothetical protein ABH920_009790 [Catenulispora sp. EB89]|uniref:hypothetical protein n=1 Tax=Catenulispora sp. EB89 TaxID=3156257 RepID=UPI003513B6AF
MANNGRQPGKRQPGESCGRDPATGHGRPAAARLHLGGDCVQLVEGKLASVAEELDRWRELALSTDFAAV